MQSHRDCLYRVEFVANKTLRIYFPSDLSRISSSEHAPPVFRLSAVVMLQGDSGCHGFDAYGRRILFQVWQPPAWRRTSQLYRYRVQVCHEVEHHAQRSEGMPRCIVLGNGSSGAQTG